MKPRVAILDLYNHVRNLGLASIRDIVGVQFGLQFDVFDVRVKCEVPDLSYDLYIFTGGPGSPLDWEGGWDKPFFSLIDALWQYNQQAEIQKHAFFICHSFQLACHHFDLGEIMPRRSQSFGVFPVHKTEDGRADPFFMGLSDPFYAADFRKYQVVQPRWENFENIGAKLLAIEKERPHIDLERAMMAIRLSDTWIATQFHPEADPEGMRVHFMKPERKKQVLEEKGSAKYAEMIAYIQDPTKLAVTYEHCLPAFIRKTIAYYATQESCV